MEQTNVSVKNSEENTNEESTNNIISVIMIEIIEIVI